MLLSGIENIDFKKQRLLDNC